MGIFKKKKPYLLQLSDDDSTEFKCLACRTGDRFYRREVSLISKTATLFDTEYWSPIAQGVVCSSCGYVHLFQSNKLRWFTVLE
ncbi:hypothetical protein [Mycobacteroides abscessus]|uniref:hypothetical protein n=1 Tax=Mycobacteroides abscessus TaxID=36809 RepID=UPI000940E450|nr:hypothetical protein [Mycobacteroides abscessus]